MKAFGRCAIVVGLLIMLGSVVAVFYYESTNPAWELVVTAGALIFLGGHFITGSYTLECSEQEEV